MQLLQDGVIALLAAIGLTALLWSLAGWIFRPRGRIPGTVFLLVPVRGAAPGSSPSVPSAGRASTAARRCCWPTAA